MGLQWGETVSDHERGRRKKKGLILEILQIILSAVLSPNLNHFSRLRVPHC